MKICCPKCKNEVPSEKVNMKTDLEYCSVCCEVFRITERGDNLDVAQEVLVNPPSKTWFRETKDEIVVGAMMRSDSIIFLIVFTIFWTACTINIISISLFCEVEGDIGMLFFVIPFSIFSILLIFSCILLTCGKVEVRIGAESEIFEGLGRLGFRKRFEWSAIEAILEKNIGGEASDVPQNAILLKGKQWTIFGKLLDSERRDYVLNMLRYLKFGEEGKSDTCQRHDLG